MNMKDLFSLLFPARVIPYATYTTTQTGAVIDMTQPGLQGGIYKSALFLLDVAIGGITFTGVNSITVEMLNSDDNVTFTDVPITSVVGPSDAALTSGVVKSWTALKAAATLNAICYRGGKRYVKLIANYNGTHGTGTALGAWVLLGDSGYQPVQAQFAVAN